MSNKRKPKKKNGWKEKKRDYVQKQRRRRRRKKRQNRRKQERKRQNQREQNKKRKTRTHYKKDTKKTVARNTKKKDRKSRNRKGRIEKKQVIQAVCVVLFLLILMFIGRPKVADELTIEAGEDFPGLKNFLLRDYKDAHFSKKKEELPGTDTIGDYRIGIMVSDYEYISVLHVVDTVKPVVKAKDLQTYTNHEVKPEDFIEEITDVTETIVDFVKEPDTTEEGKQKVELQITDAGGNSVRVTAKLELVEDTTPPVINGVKELSVAVGGNISYKKNIEVLDDYDENVKLTIDSSQVNLKKIGNYTVTYIAEDAAGNVTKKSTVVHVKRASVETATEEMVNKKADEILAKITTEDMSQKEKAKAIFDWVHSEVGWSDGTPKTDWVQGAYRGLFDRRGDCFVYASTAKCLLTRAGIKNMDIGFSNARRTHYWNLIDLGEGWYHFDATRRTDGKAFFYYNDEDIRNYSDSHNGSHAYNPSNYPEIQ